MTDTPRCALQRRLVEAFINLDVVACGGTDMCVRRVLARPVIVAASRAQPQPYPLAASALLCELRLAAAERHNRGLTKTRTTLEMAIFSRCRSHHCDEQQCHVLLEDFVGIL